MSNDKHILETSESQKAAINLILESIQKDIPVITENDFISEILPILVNYNNENVSLEKWLQYTGSYQRQLRVVNNERTQELFIVPSLLGTIATNSIPLNNNSFFQLITISNQISDRHPAQGLAQLKKGLEKKIPKFTHDLEKIKIWNNILKRYGYPEIFQFKETSKDNAESSNAKNNSLKDLVYHELDDIDNL